MLKNNEEYAKRINGVHWEDLFSALGFFVGSPGWHAFMRPKTPFETVWQQYVLSRVSSNNYATMVAVRDQTTQLKDHTASLSKAMALAFEMIPSLREHFPVKAKKAEFTRLMSLLEHQFSHQFPPGPLDQFPRNPKRLREADIRVTDLLFRNGRLIYAWHGLTAEQGRPYDLADFKDYGSLTQDIDGVDVPADRLTCILSEKASAVEFYSPSPQ